MKTLIGLLLGAVSLSVFGALVAAPVGPAPLPELQTGPSAASDIAPSPAPRIPTVPTPAPFVPFAPPAIQPPQPAPQPVQPAPVQPTPVQPVPVQPPAPQPIIPIITPVAPAPSSLPPTDVIPIGVTIKGPPGDEAVCGDMVDFELELTGNVTDIKEWVISPSSRGFRKHFTAGSLMPTVAVFSDRRPGEYHIRVTVVGTFLGKPDAATSEFILTMVPPESPSSRGAPVQATPAQQPSMPGPSVPINVPLKSLAPRDQEFWRGEIRRLLAKVGSPNTISEARIVSGCFQNLITRLRTQNFAGTDYIGDVRQQIAAYIGRDRARPWNIFFDDLERMDLQIEDYPQIRAALARVEFVAS